MGEVVVIIVLWTSSRIDREVTRGLGALRLEVLLNIFLNGDVGKDAVPEHVVDKHFGELGVVLDGMLEGIDSVLHAIVEGACLGRAFELSHLAGNTGYQDTRDLVAAWVVAVEGERVPVVKLGVATTWACPPR